MYVNKNFTVGVLNSYPGGTSLILTECCEIVICDDELTCPGCGRNVIGYDAETDTERSKIRNRQATAHWR